MGNENNSAVLRSLGLRQLEWDGGNSETDPPFGSANAAIQRHNREIEAAYRKGFEDALTGALICAGNMRNIGSVEWVLKNFAESVEQMTPERHVERLEQFKALNHREYKREKYQMIIGGRR